MRNPLRRRDHTTTAVVDKHTHDDDYDHDTPNYFGTGFGWYGLYGGSATSQYGWPPDVEMHVMLAYYRTSAALKMSVRMMRAHSVGNGYKIVMGNPEKPHGKAADDLLHKFARKFNLDKFNRDLAVESWLTGNSFMTPTTFDRKTGEAMGPRILPLSAFTHIAVDENGDPTHYRRLLSGVGGSGRYDVIPAADILHFARDNIDASPWGEGLGQTYCRSGLGYKTPTGGRKRRASYAQTDEMMDDVASTQYYQKQARFHVNMPDADPDELQSYKEGLDKMAPGAHFVTNAQGTEMKAVSLEGQGKDDQQLHRAQTNTTYAMGNPALKLWGEQVFSYASAKEALESMTPDIKGYEKDHARFVEENIFRPIITEMWSEKTWDDLDIRLVWGEQDTLDLESVLKIATIAGMPIMQGYFPRQSLFDLLQDLGVEATPLETPEQLAAPEESPTDLESEDPMKPEPPENPMQTLARHIREKKDAEIKRQIDEGRLRVLRRLNGDDR